VFSAGAYIAALVLLDGVYSPDAGGAQQRPALPRGHRLQEVVAVDVELFVVAWLFIRVVAGILGARRRLARHAVGRAAALGAQLRETRAMNSTLLGGVLRQRKSLGMRVRRAHAQGAATL